MLLTVLLVNTHTLKGAEVEGIFDRALKSMPTFSQITFDIYLLVEIKEFQNIQALAIKDRSPDQIIEPSVESGVETGRWLVRWIKWSNNDQFFHLIKSSANDSEFVIATNFAVLDSAAQSRRLSFSVGQWKEEFVGAADFKLLVDRTVQKKKVARFYEQESPQSKVEVVLSDLAAAISEKRNIDLTTSDAGNLMKFSNGDGDNIAIEVSLASGNLPISYSQVYKNLPETIIEKFSYKNIQLNGGLISNFPIYAESVRKRAGAPYFVFKSRIVDVRDAPKEVPRMDASSFDNGLLIENYARKYLTDDTIDSE